MGRQNLDTRDLILLLPYVSSSSFPVVHPVFSYPLPSPYLLSYTLPSISNSFVYSLSFSVVSWPGAIRLYPAKKLFRKMPKAGPLTRSVSKRVRPAEPPAGNNTHANAVQALSNVQSPQPHGGFGRRLHSDEIVIGLALGSPRQNPLSALPPDYRDVDVSCVCSSPENPASTLGTVCEIGSGSKGIKRKGSKWKSLGSFFGRSQVRSASPFYQLDQKQQPEPARQIIAQDYLETNALRRKRADSNHGNKAHQVDSFTGTPGEEIGEPQPEMQRIPAKYTAHAIAGDLDPHGERQGSRMPGPSLLQVEIPCVELERYSVMFGDVLEPQVRQIQRQPSLLARRQAHLEEPHTVTDSSSKSFELDLPKLGMRADSVSSKSSKSSSFSLFPSTPPLSARTPVNKLLPKPSPLSRSTTAPTHHLLPPRPAIKKSKSQDQDHVLVVVHNSEDTLGTPTSHGRQPSSNHSQRSANSTTASFFECAEYPGYSYPTTETDPPTPTNGAPQDFLKRAFPARKSSMKKLASPEPRYRNQREDPTGPPAEVSVARQISISRRQQQLLVPIVPKTARQPMQPRINEQSTTEESRKSHHLTLENA